MRRQYCIYQFQFKYIEEIEGKLTLDQHKGSYFAISETIFFRELYKLIGRAFVETIKDARGEEVKTKPQDNPLTGIFILKSSNIKTDEDKAKFERVIREGIYVNGNKFVFSDQSSSMIRTQKAIFIRETLKDQMTERITLGKEPKQCVTAKVITGKGLLLSSVDIVNIKPRIAIIPDFERKIPGKVYQVEDYVLKPEDEADAKLYEKKKIAADIKFQEYRRLKKEANEILTDMELENYPLSTDKMLKSKSAWEEMDRRVEPEELLKPEGYKRFKDGNNYPVYNILQTREIEHFPLKPYSVEYEKVFHDFKELDEGCPKINCFDGEGLMTFEFAERVKKELGLKHPLNSFQMRLPYIKSHVVRFNIKEWCKENEITHIIDIFKDSIAIEDIDIILTESCFKAKLEKTKGLNPWLFESVNEYSDLLDKYGYDYFGIANYSHPYDKDGFSSLTYQFINSTELGRHDLKRLSYYIIPLMNKVQKGDAPSTKAFLKIVNKINEMPEEDNDNDFEEIEDESNDDNDLETIKEEYEKDQCKVIIEALELNELLIHDKHIQDYLKQQIKSVYEKMQLGKLLVPSSFLFATGDVIAFIEWCCFRDKEKVKGFLKADEYFCNGIDKYKIITRYPLTHFSEFIIADMIKSDNPYVQHLNNIIQFNTYDLSMCRLNEDFDGDKNFIIDADLRLKEEGGEYDFYKKCEHEYLRDAIVEDYPIFNPADKVTAPESEFNIDSILKFEMMNLSSKTGDVTNLNSSYQIMALSEGHLTKRDLESSICRHLQGKIIDSVKLQTEVIIPEILSDNARKLPYFLRYKYGGDAKKYMFPCSDFDIFSGAIERKLNSLFYIKKANGEVEEKFVFNIPPMQTMSILLNEKVYASSTLNELIRRIRPIFNNYSSKRGEINNDSRLINRFSSKDEDKESLKEIKARYHKLYKETREKCIAELNKMNIKPDLRESILATAATKIEYIYAKDSSQNGFSRNTAYVFPWVVAPIGLLQNIKSNEDLNKNQIIQLRGFNGDAYNGSVEIIGEIIRLKDKKTINIDRLKNGKHLAISYLGKQYIHQEVTKEKELSLPSIKQYEGKYENDTPLVDLIDFTTALIRLKESVEDLEPRIENQVLCLNNYDDNGEPSFALFDSENNYLGKIRRDEYEVVDKNIALRDYVGMKFRVNITRRNTKSFWVTLNSI